MDNYRLLWRDGYLALVILAFNNSHNTTLHFFYFLYTFISLARTGKQTSKVKLSAHGIVIFAILAFNLYHSEIFKSATIMSAVLKDDLYHYRLILRENGNVENQANGPFGFSKTYKGKYKIENDLIIFSEKPYENSFIPDTLLIDKQQGALFMEKDAHGDFRTEKEWLNHFEIE